MLPRPVVAEALAQPATRGLVVTDAGYFPAATGHERRRPAGAEETVLLLPVAGSGWIESAGVRHAVGPGRCAVLPAGLPHAYGASEDHPWTIWWLHVRGAALADVHAALGVAADAAGTAASGVVLAAPRPERAAGPAGLAEEIVAMYERGTTPSHLLAATGAAWHLVARLGHDATEPALGTPVERAMRLVAERVAEPDSVADVAHAVGLSPSHLEALVREVTGGGVIAYRTALRMARARTLLDTTTLPVGRIGREVGYPDPLYFSRAFARAHGVSPSAYREQHKG